LWVDNSGLAEVKSGIDSVNIPKLGINKADPAYELDVNGTARVSGNIYTDGDIYIDDATPYIDAAKIKIGNTFDYIQMGSTGEFTVRGGFQGVWLWSNATTLDGGIDLPNGFIFGDDDRDADFFLHVAGDVGIETLPLLDTDTLVVMSNDSIGFKIESAGGGVTINDNTNNYLLTASGTANTINGESELRYDDSGGELEFQRDGTCTILMESYSTSPGNFLYMSSYNGPSGSVSAMTSNKVIGRIIFEGSSGAATHETGAQIEAKATGTWTTSSAPSELSFKVTNSGSDEPADYITLGANEVTLERNTQVEGNLDVDNVLNLDIGTIADGDATPDVSGANIMRYTTEETGGVTITDLDNPTAGAIYYIVGSDNTNTVDITDAGNFKLSGNASLGNEDVIVLLCLADNLYIEVSRSDN
jgi:hypothetical protein